MKGTVEHDGPLWEHVNRMSYPTYTCAFCHRGFKADKQGCHRMTCAAAPRGARNSANPTLTRSRSTSSVQRGNSCLATAKTGSASTSPVNHLTRTFRTVRPDHPQNSFSQYSPPQRGKTEPLCNNCDKLRSS